MLITFNEITEVSAFIDHNHHKLKGSISDSFWEVVDFRSLERHPIDAQNLVQSVQQVIEKHFA
ncbi:hypothetical protein D3C75_1316140 [compost metagenome]